MLIVQGHNPYGNVIHVILGAETDMFLDIHGANIVEITDILANMNHDEPVFISITRCKVEHVSSAAMMAASIQHRSSFTHGLLLDNGVPDAESHKKPNEIENNNDNTQLPQLCIGKCSLCNNNGVILPIPGHRICVSCAQIELGRKLSKNGKKKKKSDSSKKKDAEE